MYDTCMSRSEDLVRLDAAILDLRRLTAVPVNSPSVRHGGTRIELSTVLVVDAVSRATEAGKQSSIGDVAAVLQVVHCTASRLVDRAVRAGMVTRDRALADPRRTVVAPTGEGLRLQHEAVRFRTVRLGEMLADWPASDVTKLALLLERFARSTHTTMEESS